MIRGMTGFGRAQGQAAWGAWVWEARSVNGKSVDLRTNFPPGCEAVDFEARRRVKDRFARGSFQLQLRIDWTKDAAATAIDTRELARLARLSRLWSRNGAGVAPASFDGLLNATGVTKGASRTSTAVDEATAKELLAGLDHALDMLAAARQREGVGMSHLEAGDIVEPVGLRLDRLTDARMAVAGIDAPEPGHAVENPAPVRREIVIAFRPDEEPRRALEAAVRGEGHPMRIEIIGAGGGGGHGRSRCWVMME